MLAVYLFAAALARPTSLAQVQARADHDDGGLLQQDHEQVLDDEKEMDEEYQKLMANVKKIAPKHRDHDDDDDDAPRHHRHRDIDDSSFLELGRHPAKSSFLETTDDDDNEEQLTKGETDAEKAAQDVESIEKRMHDRAKKVKDAEDQLETEIKAEGGDDGSFGVAMPVVTPDIKSASIDPHLRAD